MVFTICQHTILSHQFLDTSVPLPIFASITIDKTQWSLIKNSAKHGSSINWHSTSHSQLAPDPPSTVKLLLDYPSSSDNIDDDLIHNNKTISARRLVIVHIHRNDDENDTIQPVRSELRNGLTKFNQQHSSGFDV
ncbi:hypothetical protein DERF_008184 [Dermatophagoides farinae]|uniref:Uncharacterized protein n=1 Tax=Dermatophagoides farinae TaxID=6954 RepID=A0A922L4G8_DERFA|nr:hypothetical protein DERF_008184 [Dermatophagoides farinae]